MIFGNHVQKLVEIISKLEKSSTDDLIEEQYEDAFIGDCMTAGDFAGEIATLMASGLSKYASIHNHKTSNKAKMKRILAAKKHFEQGINELNMLKGTSKNPPIPAVYG